MAVKENTTGNLPLYLFHQGTNFRSYDYLGAHFTEVDGKKGVTFRTWAPRAWEVSVIGDLNGWNDKSHPMKRISDGGVFELFIEGLSEYDAYKYAVKSEKTVWKADPYAFHGETPPKTASKIYDLDGFSWGDAEFIKNKRAPYDKPMNIYEVNLASWKKKPNGDYYSYLELAVELVDYVVDMGYTHVEFMPVTEYPFDGSWGYQQTGYYAVSSRFGTPKDFMALVDAFHKKGIAVIVDWVPAHFPTDEHGLFEFDGHPCYENQGWDRMEHKTWGTRIFDWARNEVRCFLISNAMFLFDKFHVDGLRVDAVASMLYLDYDRKPGEWMPNEHGGNYNLQAIDFLKKLNETVFGSYPNALMIAEESTAFPMVTRPTNVGGLGFNFKWNMGWMNDSLSYIKTDPFFRSADHYKITFSLCYAFSENYVLPISHDEVVHGKKSLLDKMPGRIEDKFANLRTYLLFMYAHPGKKLSFMGNEFGQFKEWNYKEGLEFFMINFDNHRKLWNFNKALNRVYKDNAPLYERDDSYEGFSWVSEYERDNNVISFIRYDKCGKEIVALFNFSGNDYYEYRLGLDVGEYKILLCTDDRDYGGNDKVEKKVYKTEKYSAHGRDNSILLRLPAFTGIYFEKIK